MAIYRILTFLCLVGCCISAVFTNKYTADWASLDKRPTPPWYDEAKFGIFIHWGVFSVPSFGSEWFWENWQGKMYPAYVNFMHNNYRPDFTYPDFGPMFTAEFFDPNRWADVIKASGAKYVVLTSKHHEGYTLWPSAASWNWNSMDVGPRRDLVGALANAIRNRTDVRFGLYHSLFEWFNRLYLADKANGFKTQDFVRMKTLPELYELVTKYKPEVIWSDGDWEAPYTYWNATNFLAWLFNDRKTMPELYELVTTYKPEVLWSDGASGPDTYWNSTHFLAWLFNESPVAATVAVNDRWGKYTRMKHGGFYDGGDKFNPGELCPGVQNAVAIKLQYILTKISTNPVKDTVATNDRWGSGCVCKHGGYYTCSDRYNPGHLLKHKWENCMTLDRRSWGFRREMTMDDILTMHDVISELVSTVSCGGNLLMNIGPTHDGRIVPIFEDRLKEMGEWLGVNGEAIYGTKPWTHQNDTVTSGVWYTSKVGSNGATSVYAITLSWPEGDSLLLGAPVSGHGTSVHLLGYPHEFDFKAGKSGLEIIIPPIPVNKMPCKYAWVFKLDGLVGGAEKGSGVDDVLRFMGNL